MERGTAVGDRVPSRASGIFRIDGAVSALHNPSEEFELSRASQSLIDDVHDFRHFFLDAERSLNDKVFKNAKNDGYGSTIKRYWAKPDSLQRERGMRWAMTGTMADICAELERLERLERQHC